MSSAVCSEVETSMAFVNRNMRSLSHASQHSSPTDVSPPFTSPFIPGTPTNTPSCASPAIAASSPPTADPPANTPVSNIDSGVASPVDPNTTIQFHPPDFIKLHHFYSPLLRPMAPPNSPEAYPISGDGMASIDEEVHTSLGERLAALTLATSKKDGISSAEMKILKEDVPKAPENDWYEIRAVPGAGYGCFAKTLIKRGTRILADGPLLIVPEADYFLEHVQEAFAKLTPAEKALYFTLYSAHGQDPAKWPKHVHESVSNRERCRIMEQHNARTGKEPSLISIFQTNCMEKDNGAAVFPHAARFNHSCNPNATFTWNWAIGKQTIHAMKDIQKDEQITISYVDIMQDLATRKWALKHYGFECDCPACGDDSDPKSFAAVSAERRFRLLELDEAFIGKRAQDLESGVRDPKLVPMLLDYVNLLIAEGDHTMRLAHAYLDMALVAERNGDFKTAFLNARKAVEVETNCHGTDHPNRHLYTAAMERIREKRRAELKRE